MTQVKDAAMPCPESTTDLRRQLHQQVDRLADWCEQYDGRFFYLVPKLELCHLAPKHLIPSVQLGSMKEVPDDSFPSP